LKLSVGDSKIGRWIGWTAAAAFFLFYGVASLADDSAEIARRALPLVKIDGKPLTIFFFEEAAKRRNPAALASEAARAEFLDELIDEILLADEATRRGYDRHEEVQTLYKKTLASIMRIVIETPIDAVEPSEQELREYYDSHLDKYHRPAWVRAKHRVFEDEQAARRVLRELLENKPTEANGDEWLDTGYFRRPKDGEKGDADVLPQLAEAAFTLKKDGEVFSSLIRSAKGLHILMRTDYRPAIIISFEKAKRRGLADDYRRTLKRQTFEDTLELLKKRYPVEIDEAALMEVVIVPCGREIHRHGAVPQHRDGSASFRRDGL
jgi:parvulin-like peptidyl-prolyl isomerase